MQMQSMASLMGNSSILFSSSLNSAKKTTTKVSSPSPSSPSPSPPSCPIRAAMAASPPPSNVLTSPWEPLSFNDGSPTTFPPIINGCWTLAGGHGRIAESDILPVMDLYSRNGLSAFDTADIYGPSESILGRFLSNYPDPNPNPKCCVFTKFVPNIFRARVTPAFVEQSIRRSMEALGVEKLDLVQMHWWDYKVPGMVDAALALANLRNKGLITSIGVTNMNTEALAAILDAGVPVVANQIQFSLLDRRPIQKMLPFCVARGIKLLAYGPLGGGLLSDRYLGSNRRPNLNTSSLNMYWRNIQMSNDGEPSWQRLLSTLAEIASRKSVSVANVALRWLIQQGPVCPIVGLRSPDHLEDNLRVFSFSLDEEEMAAIDAVLQDLPGPSGDVYDMERGM